jgi:hypothetical protein
MQPRTVEKDLTFNLLVTDHYTMLVSARLRYDTNDPYAVTLTFRDREGQAFDWTFARELLSDGVFSPTGQGAIRVWPGENRLRGQLCIAIGHSPEACQLTAPRSKIVTFLRKTEALVPFGYEGGFMTMDLDEELARLLQS